VTTTLISFVGLDRNARWQQGQTLTDNVATLTRFVNVRHTDGWRCLTVRDLDHGRIVGGIEHNSNTDTRTWWTR
jgi:hypothetical protein